MKALNGLSNGPTIMSAMPNRKPDGGTDQGGVTAVATITPVMFDRYLLMTEFDRAIPLRRLVAKVIC